MPSSEDQPDITFSEYPGGPPITFREQHSIEWYVEEEPPLVPRWAIPHRAILAPPRRALIGPADVLSRELALAAARQFMLSFDRGREAFVTKSVGGTSTEQIAGHDSEGELCDLQEKVKFLEAQLESQMPHLQLYRLGAGSLFVAVISIIVWLMTGTGIPFHPIFAAGVIPASLGVIAIAFLIRPSSRPKQ